MEKNARQQKETWKVFGSDEVLEDKNLIEYYQLHQFDEKLSNRLLGEFTGEGEYVLPDEIKKTLVKVKKNIIHSGENSYLAETVIGTRGIRFLVKYWAVEDKGVANLYFIEHLDDEELQTFVAQYIGEKDESFLVRMKGAFNLQNDVEKFEDEYLEDLETQYSILERKKAERDFVVELQSEFYLYEILAVLKEQGGEAGKQIANQIEIEIEEKKRLTNKEGLYTNARLKMNKMIIAAGGFKQLGQKVPQLPKLVQNYTKPVKDYDDISRKLDAMKPPSDEAATNQGGSAKKSSGAAKKKGGSAKKSGGGSSGGGKKGGKKADKKDDKDKKKQDVLLGGNAVKNALKRAAAMQELAQKQQGVLKTDKMTALATGAGNEKVQTSVSAKEESRIVKTANQKKVANANGNKRQNTVDTTKNVPQKSTKKVLDLANPDLLLELGRRKITKVALEDVEAKDKMVNTGEKKINAESLEAQKEHEEINIISSEVSFKENIILTRKSVEVEMTLN